MIIALVLRGVKGVASGEIQRRHVGGEGDAGRSSDQFAPQARPDPRRVFRTRSQDPDGVKQAYPRTSG